MIACIFLFVFSDDNQWIEALAKKPQDKEALNFVKSLQKNKKCCTRVVHEMRDQKSSTQPNIKLYIFMSFTIPIFTWKELGKQAIAHSVQFVIRGLPNNSFQDLAKKVQEIDFPVIINPDLFEQFGIDRVPAFVFVQDDRYEGVFGNVSLSYAVDYLKNYGNGVVRGVQP